MEIMYMYVIVILTSADSAEQTNLTVKTDTMKTKIQDRNNY